MSREFEWAPLRLGRREKRSIKRTDKKPDTESVESRKMLKPTSEEVSLLNKLINKGLKRIKSKLSPESITYEGLDEFIEEYGAKELTQMLESLANKGFLTIEGHDPTLFCPACHSSHVYSRYVCPRCQSINVGFIELIEHQFCGFTDVKSKFILDLSLVCPNCKTELGPLDGEPPRDGSKYDYKIIGSSFECEKCGNRFNKPNIQHICQLCGENFDYKTAIYNKLHDYEVPDNVIKNMRGLDECKILLIEDDPNDAEIIIKYFDEYKEDFNVEHVTSGRTGLEKIMQKYFDIILLDIKLPGMDGLEVLKEIKDKEINIPILILTGTDDRETAVNAMKLGASDYIVKSLEAYRELPLRIKKTLQE